MTYLDFERLEQIDPRAFQETRPYPWINPEGLLHEAGYASLVKTLPPVSMFEKKFGVKRKHGQKPHDRYTLEYREGLDLSPPWRDFMEEIRSERYRQILCRLLDVRSVDLNFHWHYTPRGCSVSPHCDATRKLGSHIFYLNPEGEWDPSWGGETVVLDDHGRFDRRSAPEWSDFDAQIVAEAVGNRSLLFGRGERSWHGVREVLCPPEQMRKVFIVVINSDGPLDKLRALVTGRSTYRY